MPSENRDANYSDFGGACPILNLKLRSPISPLKLSDFLSYQQKKEKKVVFVVKKMDRDRNSNNFFTLNHAL
jgi:hypothetical protein